VNAQRQFSRSLGLRSFGSFGKGSHTGTRANGLRSKQKTGKIYNYPLKQEAPEK
jgi:hypothetical protein